MKNKSLLSIVALVASVSNTNAVTLAADGADATWSLNRSISSLVVTTYDAGTSGTSGVVLQNATAADPGLQIGGTSSNAAIATAIIPFVLPTLAPGQSFANASFSLLSNSSSNAQQIDLYGLGVRASATVQASDYYRGTTGGDTTDALLLQGAFISTTDTFTASFRTTSAAGGINLTAYLNAQYAAGGAGQAVFLRTNVTDTFTTANTRLDATSQNGTAANRPFITYDIIPEPSVALLSAIGVLALLRRRRA
jgi:hypothetical protein